MSVRERFVAPTVGGLVTSTILTLVVIPAIYSLWKERDLAFVTAPAQPPSESRVLRGAPTKG